jgi:hypothetical protein
MKRHLLSSVVGMLILSCCAVVLAQATNATYSQRGSTQKDVGRQYAKADTTSVRRDAPTIRVIFRGLMIFHFDTEKLLYEVGVLRAPNHQLRIHVEKRSPSGTSEILVPVEELGSLDKRIWTLELTNPGTQGISTYQNGAFNRKKGIGDDRDFRWTVDLEGEEFYNNALSIKTALLGPIIRIPSGMFYTMTKTEPLLRKQGDHAFQEFGSIAEDIAADIWLDNGEAILKADSTEIVRLKRQPHTTYDVIIENTPSSHQHLSSNVDHFDYYYDLIDNQPGGRFGFAASKLRSSLRMMRSAGVYTFAPDATTLAPGIPPYKCGGIFLSRRKISLISDR